MTKKRSAKKSTSPPRATHPSPIPVNPKNWPTRQDWCNPLAITERQAADIAIFAQRATLSPTRFILDACRQVNSANLLKAHAAADRSRLPDAPKSGSSSATPPDYPKVHKEPF